MTFRPTTALALARSRPRRLRAAPRRRPRPPPPRRPRCPPTSSRSRRWPRRRRRRPPARTPSTAGGRLALTGELVAPVRSDLVPRTGGPRRAGARGRGTARAQGPAAPRAGDRLPQARPRAGRGRPRPGRRPRPRTPSATSSGRRASPRRARCRRPPTTARRPGPSRRRAARAAARAALDTARQRLADAVLTSPVDGVVAERRTDVGERLGEGTVAFVVEQTAPAEAALPRARALPRRGARSARRCRPRSTPTPARSSRGRSAWWAARSTPPPARSSSRPSSRTATGGCGRASSPASRSTSQGRLEPCRSWPRSASGARSSPGCSSSRSSWSGLFAYDRLGVDRFPKIDFPFVTISTRLVGRGAGGDRDRDHRQDRGGGQHDQRHRPADLDLVRGRLARSSSSSTSRRTPTSPPRRCATASTACCATCPRDADPPVIEKIDPDAAPVLSVAVSAAAPIRDVTEFADKMLRRQLESVLGVGQVQLIGGRLRQINVDRRPREARRPRPDRGRGGAGPRLARTSQLPGGRVEQGAARPDAAHLRPRRRRPRTSATS